jgi:phosphoglycolate phosphatase-like HAD superfamily hydrolase
MIKEQAFKKVFLKFGEDVASEAVKHHRENLGLNRFHKFKYIIEAYTNNEFDNDLANKLSDEFSQIVLESMISCNYIENGEYFLENYHKKLMFFVSSAMPNSELIEIINKRGMDKYFRKVQGYPVEKSKFISIILNEFNFDRSEVVFIGDAQSDYDSTNENLLSFICIGGANIKGNILKRVNNYIELETFLFGDK